MDILQKVTWSTAEQTLKYKVYLGLWTNWSRGSVLGKTLTLSRQQGDLLIAFTAFFVAFVGSRFWSIVCLIFHRNYSTIQPRDTLHHQWQVILRNGGSPDTGLLKLVQLLWAWRRSPWSLIKILPAALTALLCVAAFTLAGGFSSQISSSVGNEVLLDGVNCGTLVSNGSSLPVEMASYFAQLVNNAQNYVQQCYSTGSSGLIDCKAFVTERIPLFINDTAQCPFQTRVCRSNIPRTSFSTPGILVVTTTSALTRLPTTGFLWEEFYIVVLSRRRDSLTNTKSKTEITPCTTTELLLRHLESSPLRTRRSL